jgi:hypothetical protein
LNSQNTKVLKQPAHTLLIIEKEKKAATFQSSKYF